MTKIILCAVWLYLRLPSLGTMPPTNPTRSPQLDGSTHRGRIAQSYGGVGRNVADALARLGHRPHFVSSVGRDQLGSALVSNNQHMVRHYR